MKFENECKEIIELVKESNTVYGFYPNESDELTDKEIEEIRKDFENYSKENRCTTLKKLSNKLADFKTVVDTELDIITGSDL